MLEKEARPDRVRIVLNPDSKVEAAKKVTDKVAPLINKISPSLPTDTRTQALIVPVQNIAAIVAEFERCGLSKSQGRDRRTLCRRYIEKKLGLSSSQVSNHLALDHLVVSCVGRAG